MIEVEHVSKAYGGRKVVDDISFRVKKGEILGFLGPNGAGKTTTMRILTCYMPATEGTARIAGHDVFEESLEVRRRIGYLPENPPLYPEMTVDSYLNFVARIKGVRSNARKARVGDAIEKCNLGDVRRRIIGRLSKGYKQRVGLAQAIVGNPEVLILDEPTIGLDPRQIHEVRSLIKGLGEAHTVILSTHILPEVSMTCSRVVIINNGKVVAQDTPEGLAHQMKGAERISLTVEAPAAAVREKILAIDGVLDVHAEEKGEVSTCSVECRLGSDLRRILARQIVDEGWGLLELRAVSMSLEDVFINLITQE
ncbi:MAG: ATP-binding cassette domain-containing protein [Acidobacteriota bacterium]|nr:ATP-binding cassette domain-containing protein [Acidobacteriota bacterium]NLT33669.1 ATP-binding cassette domain-containing protein [Acidobacteriota bacterium]